ncbi:MAG: autotransporter domain-containing protein, partial [Elusimicrobiota bacterium]|nr:autotransporter domain-containing protein [Elusimicrobiota bacterium]
ILDKNNPIIFNRLSLYLKDSRKGAWAFGRFGATDVNLKETQFAKRFNQTKNGTVFGYDIFNNEANTFLMGAYGVYDFIEARQLQDRGEIENFELGFYGVKSVKLWQRPISFLTNFSFGHQEYNLIRQISAGRYSFSPRANFSSKSLKINLETEFAFAIERKLYLKPFIGLQGGILFNESFSENSGQPASLDVESGNNYRVRVVAGLGVENKYERIIWNMRIYAAEVLAEHAAKINVKFLDSKFSNSNEIVSEREYFLAGAQGSFNYLVGKNILASLNGSVEYGQDLFSYYGGIGFSYKFKGLERTEITGDVFDNAYLLFVQKKYLKAAEILNGLLNDINHQEDAKDILEKIERQVNKDAKDEEALDFSELTYAKGYISYQTGDLAEAVLQWKKFLEFSQDKRDVVEYMARSERTLNRQLQDSYENKAAVIFEKGIKNFNNGQWVECIKTMEKLQSYVNKNKFAQSAYYNSCAKEYIRKSIAQLAKLKDTAAHRENDKTENAVNAPAHNEAAHIDENGAQEKYNEGLELYAQGRYMQAQRAWEQALRLNPNHTKAKVALASLKDEQE